MKIQDEHNSMILADLVLVAVFVSAILGLSACQQEGPAEKTGRKIDQSAAEAGKKLESAKESLGNKAEQSGEYLDDSAITAKVKAEILSDPLLKSSQISVTTTHGVVNLSGLVDSRQSVDRALEIARSIQNVKSVENNLAVKDAK